MGIRKVGNWVGARAMSMNLRKDIDSANLVAMRQIGLKGERMVVKYIQSQPSVWPALSEKYQESKVRHKLSGLMLRRTGDMINRITSYATRQDVFIGIKRDVVAKLTKDGEKLWSIAAVMEFGSKKRSIPARPYMRPTHEELLKMNIQDLFSELYLKECKRKYKV